MKTAMQQVIDKRNELSQNDFDTWILSNKKQLLEKEKETIKESWWDGFKLKRVVVDSNADEIYFNQKYNNNEGTTLG